MSPVKGQNVKSALSYNSQLRNMSDMQFMRHLGWMESSSSNRENNKRHGYGSAQQAASFETANGQISTTSTSSSQFTQASHSKMQE